MPQVAVKFRMGAALLVLAAAFSPLAPNALAAKPLVVSSGAGLQISSLPIATVGQPYVASLFVGGGTAPYAWTASGLPAGLALSASGQLSGTPTAASSGGLSTFAAQVTDSSKTPLTAKATVGILILAAAPPALSVDPVNLPAATVGQPYKDALTAKGGVAPYTWTLSAGSTVPAGLALSSAGLLSGTPTTATGPNGPDSFGITVTDSSPTPLKATATISLAIAPAAKPLAIASVKIPSATVGVPYSTQLAATGGTAPYAWFLGKGVTLPAGLSLSANGILSGTPTAPTAAAGQAIGVSVSDSSAAPQTASATLTLVVAAPTGPSLTVASVKLPPAYAGSSYSYQLTALGGTPPYAWAVAPIAALPAGLTLSPSGLLSGTATAASPSAIAQIAVTVTDSSASPKSATGTLGLPLYPQPAACSHDGSGNARLSGQYALTVSGFDAFSNSHLHMLGTITADGAGTLTNGSADSNAPEWNAPSKNALSGTYSIGSQDSRGELTIANSDSEPAKLCFVADQIGGVATSGSLIRADESGQFLAGTFALQNPKVFTAASLKGNFTVGLQGSSLDSTGILLRSALAGYLTFDGTGKITAGEADMSQQKLSQAGTNSTGPAQIVNKTEAQIPLTGSYTVANTGRGTLELATPDGGTVHFAFQVISASELDLLEIDGVPAGAGCCGSVMAGKALLQTSATFNDASLAGTSVYLKNGVANPGTAQSGRDIEAGILTFDGKGNVTVLNDENAAGSVRTQNTSAASYSVDAVGRVTVQAPANGTTGNPGDNLPTFYMVGQNQGFGVNSSTGVGFFEVLDQTSPVASVSGAFGLGTVWPAATAKLQSGSVTVSAAGAVAGATDSNQSGAIAIDQAMAATLTASPNGRYLFTPAGRTAPQSAIYIVSPTVGYAIDISGSDSAPLLSLNALEIPSAPSKK